MVIRMAVASVRLFFLSTFDRRIWSCDCCSTHCPERHNSVCSILEEIFDRTFSRLKELCTLGVIMKLFKKRGSFSMIGTEADLVSEFKSADTGPANFRVGRGREPVVALNYSRSFASVCSVGEPGSFSTPCAGGRLYKKSCEATQSNLALQKRLYKRFSKAWRQRTENAAKLQCKDKSGGDSDVDSSEYSNYSIRTDDSESSLNSSTLRGSLYQEGDEPQPLSISVGTKCRSETNLSSNVWHPPSSDLYNAPIADGAEDMETLRRWAQRHRITAAKLLPKMHRCQRDSGIAMHERTLSKDSSSSQSPKATTRLLKSPPVSYSESSSIATDLSSNSSYVGSGSGAGLESMVEVCTTVFLETDLLDDNDPAKSAAVVQSSCPDGYRPDVSGQEPITPCLVDLCSATGVNVGVEDDDGYCSIQVDSLARSDKMSSSNLVYAIPVKPSYDSPRVPPSQNMRCASPLSAWPRTERNSKDFEVVHLPPSPRNEPSEMITLNGISSQYESVQSTLPGVESNRVTPIDRMIQSSPQSVPKRTVVPVYPFQTHSPTVEPVLTVMKHCENGPAEPCVPEQSKIVSTDSEVVKYINIPMESNEHTIQSHWADKSNEDCLSKPLDAVLTNLVSNIMAGAHSFSEKATSYGIPKAEDGAALFPSFSSSGDEKVLTSNSNDLEKEKLELISRLSRKLKVLKEEKREIEEEIRSNEAIGNDLLSFVENSQASAAVKQKLRTYVQDVERITKLFLKLSAQLKRIVRQLNRTGDEQLVDVQSLKDRRAQLLSQLEDAKELKDGIYVRGAQLAKLLPQIFGPEQMIDYQYFVQMKSKLLVEAQEVDDKIAHGEEQKEVLEHS
ncbi:hypothetical protein M514_10977 [Trichuris suis]|uniref:ASD2 domain-containing protein n=1 Tax=Trichuris suis TaxID=68888 RepID=A0A085MWZ8_9BILA|nr:hypothetical protein M514_10977 [Trichuris suis]